MKEFNEMSNVGRVKYVVNHHDGVKQHPDGSPFFDVATFQNKRKKAAFVKGLLAKGYRTRQEAAKA
jgi:hypothetical protein